MKICKECGRSVSNYQWNYGSDTCKRCYGRMRYRERNPESKVNITILEEISKEELIKVINQRNAVIYNQKKSNSNKSFIIKHFKIRIKKIRNSLDYLLEHPYSNDSGFTTNKHKRDGSKLSESYQSKKHYERRKKNETKNK